MTDKIQALLSLFFIIYASVDGVTWKQVAEFPYKDETTAEFAITAKKICDASFFRGYKYMSICNGTVCSLPCEFPQIIIGKDASDADLVEMTKP